jgi:hypothetical protein
LISLDASYRRHSSADLSGAVMSMEDDEEQGVGSEHCSATSGDVLDAKTSYR